MKPMRRGDYRVQVHIIEARDLQPRDIGDMNDPVCRVTVMEQKQYTKIHSKCLSCEFDEVLYFEFRDKEVAEIKQGKVLVEVMDANTFTANQLVGLYQLDLTRIYYREHHEMHQQWVGLYDPVGTHACAYDI